MSDRILVPGLANTKTPRARNSSWKVQRQAEEDQAKAQEKAEKEARRLEKQTRKAKQRRVIESDSEPEEEDDNDDEEEPPLSSKFKISSTRISDATSKSSRSSAPYRTSVVPPVPQPARLQRPNDDDDESFSDIERREQEDDPDADKDEPDEDGEPDLEAIVNKAVPKKKRKAPATDAEVSHDTVRVVKTVKNKENENASGRPRASDFEATVRAVIRVAAAEYRCCIATICAFPTTQQEYDMATQVWQKACVANNVTIPLTPELLKLITNRASQIRGDFKTKAMQTIEEAYNLLQVKPSNPVGIAKQKKRVQDMIDAVSYVYKDPVTRKGLYLAPSILRVMKRIFFLRRNCEGARHLEYFKPRIPLALVALVLTLVKNVLDEYAEGIHKPKDFTGDTYRDAFTTHLHELKKWAKKNPEWVEKWTEQLLTTMIDDIGVGLNDGPVNGVLSNQDFDEAAATLNDNDLLDLGGFGTVADDDA